MMRGISFVPILVVCGLGVTQTAQADPQQVNFKLAGDQFGYHLLLDENKINLVGPEEFNIHLKALGCNARSLLRSANI